MARRCWMEYREWQYLFLAIPAEVVRFVHHLVKHCCTSNCLSASAYHPTLAFRLCVESSTICHPPFSVLVSFRFLSPFCHQLLRQPQVIEHTRDDSIHDLFNRFWMRVKRGIGGQDGRSGQQQQLQVLHMHQV